MLVSSLVYQSLVRQTHVTHSAKHEYLLDYCYFCLVLSIEIRHGRANAETRTRRCGAILLSKASHFFGNLRGSHSVALGKTHSTTNWNRSPKQTSRQIL